MRRTTTEHCWHDTTVLVRNEDKVVSQVCCFDRETRTLEYEFKIPPGHGPYSPNRTAVLRRTVERGCSCVEHLEP